jgi:hypothetical protein
MTNAPDPFLDDDDCLLRLLEGQMARWRLLALVVLTFAISFLIAFFAIMVFGGCV